MKFDSEVLPNKIVVGHNVWSLIATEYVTLEESTYWLLKDTFVLYYWLWLILFKAKIQRIMAVSKLV